MSVCMGWGEDEEEEEGCGCVDGWVGGWTS